MVRHPRRELEKDNPVAPEPYRRRRYIPDDKPATQRRPSMTRNQRTYRKRTG